MACSDIPKFFGLVKKCPAPFFKHPACYNFFMTGYIARLIQDNIPEDAVFIIGAGHFGGRAARILSRVSKGPIFVVDREANRLSGLEGLAVDRIHRDAILFLSKNYHLLRPTNTVVPAVPLHLAYEWLKRHLEGKYHIEKIDIPKGIKPSLPHTWPGNDGSLLISYADFICPEDCPEPDLCTVTGEIRQRPLYKLLNHVDSTGFKIHIIKSIQLAPGLGGYKAGELSILAEKLIRKDMGKWLLGTACKCHGILTAFEIRKCQ